MRAEHDLHGGGGLMAGMVDDGMSSRIVVYEVYA